MIERKGHFLYQVPGRTVLLVAAFVLTIVVLGLSLRPVLERTLTRKLQESAQGKFNLTLEGARLELFPLRLHIEHLRASSDSAVALREKDAFQPWEFHAEGVSINGLSVWPAVFSKKISIKTITIDTLMLDISRTSSDGNSESGYQKILVSVRQKINSLAVDEFSIASLNLSYKNAARPLRPLWRIEELQFSAKGFLIDSSTRDDNDRMFLFTDFQLTIPKWKIDLPQTPYQLHLGELAVNSRHKEVSIGQLKLTPRISRADYVRQDRQNKALIDLVLRSFTISGVDFLQLSKSGKLIAETANIDKGTLELFKDKRFQKETVSKIGQSPAQQLMQIPICFSIPHIKISDFNLSYQEIGEKYGRQGRIDFNAIHGSLANVTNDTTVLRKKPLLVADLRGRIYGQGELQALFKFNLLSPKGAYSYRGSLSLMSMLHFNSILTPLLNIRVTSGSLRHAAFDIQADEWNSRGTMDFKYHGFGLEILNKPSKGGGKKAIVSFFANKFIINDSNPDANERYRRAEIAQQRVAEHPFFKSIWKTLLEGIMYSTGVNPKFVPD